VVPGAIGVRQVDFGGDVLVVVGEESSSSSLSAVFNRTERREWGVWKRRGRGGVPLIKDLSTLYCSNNGSQLEDVGRLGEKYRRW
jgi:hypothetical protein